MSLFLFISPSLSSSSPCLSTSHFLDGWLQRLWSGPGFYIIYGLAIVCLNIQPHFVQMYDYRKLFQTETCNILWIFCFPIFHFSLKLITISVCVRVCGFLYTWSWSLISLHALCQVSNSSLCQRISYTFHVPKSSNPAFSHYLPVRQCLPKFERNWFIY